MSQAYLKSATCVVGRERNAFRQLDARIRQIGGSQTRRIARRNYFTRCQSRKQKRMQYIIIVQRVVRFERASRKSANLRARANCDSANYNYKRALSLRGARKCMEPLFSLRSFSHLESGDAHDEKYDK